MDQILQSKDSVSNWIKNKTPELKTHMEWKWGDAKEYFLKIKIARKLG